MVSVNHSFSHSVCWHTANVLQPVGGAGQHRGNMQFCYNKVLLGLNSNKITTITIMFNCDSDI